MNISSDRPVAIIGCGLAGLTAASHLARHGVPFRIFEAAKVIGGLARSEFDDEGFTYDFGAHFITNRLAAAIGISAKCRDMVRYGESVWYRGQASSYPFGLMRNPRYVASAIKARVAGLTQPAPTNAREAYRRQYGSALTQEIAEPLTQAWSGLPADKLSPAVANKFANSIGRTMMLKTAGWLTHRTVAVGYSGTVKETPHVWHVYPEGGIATACDALAREIKHRVELDAPVERIDVEGERVVGIHVRGEAIPVSAVVSTAPVHVLPKLVHGTLRLQPLARFQYRAMISVNVKLEGPSHLPDVVTWLPERDFPFFRLSDIGAGLPWLVPAGRSLVTCDIGCAAGDELWKTDDADLGRRCLAGLDRIVPGTTMRYIGCRVMRAALAYPIFAADYETERQQIEQGTGIEGLISVGRNGEFSHALMEDVYWRTRRRLMPLIERTRAGIRRGASVH